MEFRVDWETQIRGSSIIEADTLEEAKVLAEQDRYSGDLMDRGDWERGDIQVLAITPIE